MIEGGPGQDEFYLTLPSDSSKAYFDKQDASHFFTKLHGGVRLYPGEWMVGLVEITYPATYDNIPVSEFTAEYHVPDKPDAVHRSRCAVRAKHYIAPQDLINDWLKSFISHPNHSYYRGKRKIRLAYDKISERATFSFDGSHHVLKLSHPLTHALGFREEDGVPYEKADGSGGIRIPKEIQRSEATVDVRAHHPVNVDRLIPVIYVYCDLIERQQVGDSYVQLLRTLPTRSGVRGDLITETFDNIHYSGVERGSLEMVEIHLVDHLGINIPFRRDIVTVKLHFKRKGTAG